MFAEHDAETLQRVWQSLFKRYKQVLRARGSNDFEVKRTETAQGQKRGRGQGMATMVKISRGVFNAALDW